MQPTKRLWFLTGAGILLTGMAALVYQHKIVFFLYNAILLVLCWLDYRQSKPEFKIWRENEEKLSLFCEEEMGWGIRNEGSTQLHIEVADGVPDFNFDIVASKAATTLESGGYAHLSYKLIPKKRGFYIFEETFVRYLSRWGLLYRHLHLTMPGQVKVYPNLRDLRKYRLMVYGGYLMRGGKRVWHQRGEGLEFESLREYVYGDSYNKINWKATAGMNKPIINQYEVEKNQDVIALIDSGRAMSYEVRGYKKLDLAINTALILSDIANLTGDKSGLMVFNTKVQQYVKPASGAAHRNQLMEALYTVDYSRDASNFGEAFVYLSHHQKKRSLIFMFTEFETMDEAAEYLNVLPLIAKRHLVILFMMTKEKVIEFAKDHANKDEEMFIKGAAYEILTERQKILSVLRRSGIMCIECLPDSLTTEVVNQYIQLKHRHV